MYSPYMQRSTSYRYVIHDTRTLFLVYHVFASTAMKFHWYERYIKRVQ